MPLPAGEAGAYQMRQRGGDGRLGQPGTGGELAAALRLVRQRVEHRALVEFAQHAGTRAAGAPSHVSHGGTAGAP